MEDEIPDVNITREQLTDETVTVDGIWKRIEGTCADWVRFARNVKLTLEEIYGTQSN